MSESKGKTQNKRPGYRKQGLCTVTLSHSSVVRSPGIGWLDGFSAPDFKRPTLLAGLQSFLKSLEVNLLPSFLGYWQTSVSCGCQTEFSLLAVDWRVISGF